MKDAKDKNNNTHRKLKDDGSGEYEDALETIKRTLALDLATQSVEQLKEVEETLIECAKDLVEKKRTEDIIYTLSEVRLKLHFFSRAKAGHILRTLLDLCMKTQEHADKKLTTIEECIAWCQTENRQYLRRSLESRLIRLHNDSGSHVVALERASKLISELKKLNDRELLVEVVLEESRAAYSLNNPGKARASLVMAKTLAHKSYLIPQMQAMIDMQSGCLAAEEADFRTAFSYFYETFENYEPLRIYPEECIKALKYMCLCKIMLDEAEQLTLMLRNKGKVGEGSSHLEAMKALGKAFEQKSLTVYHEVNTKYEKELRGDQMISRNASRLYDKLFEKEVLRLVAPYDVVELDHLIKLIGLPEDKVERSISMLILDKKINGVLDQSNRTLIIHRPTSSDRAYQKANNLIVSLGKVIDAQYERPRFELL